MSKRKISGTREWAESSCNFVNGCWNDCRYCYARYNMHSRYKKLKRWDDWKWMAVRPDEVRKGRNKKEGRIMTPTTHDIIDGPVLAAALIVWRKLLEAGNDLLIVSKPRLECITKICNEFHEFKKQIMFRFTIGSTNDEILGYWEPNAPTFLVRQACLCHAFNEGFVTSVSAEPLLDANSVEKLVKDVEMWVNDSIWIGKLNHVDSRVRVETPRDESFVEMIKAGQTDEKIREIYEALKDHPFVKWKESYKEVLGLKLADEAGEDA